MPNLTAPVPAPSQEPEESIGLVVTSGLSPGAKLREERMFALHPLGADFRSGEMSLKQWRVSLKPLAQVKGAFYYWLADFIGYGYEHYDREAVEGALVEMGFAQFDVDRALAILHTPRGIRTHKLTSEHYYVLYKAGLDSGGMTRWAHDAIEHKLTAVELENSIAAKKIVKSLNDGGIHSRGFSTVEGFRQTFDSWFKRVEENDPISKWPTDRKAQVFEELRPSTMLGIKLARELGINLEEGK